MSLRYESLPRRIRFAAGAIADLPGEVEALGCHQVLLVASTSTADVAQTVERLLGATAAGLFAGARVHVPSELADRARTLSRSLGADGLVAIGGGSAIGLAKAIALTDGVPIVAVPTTYAGSELTPVWGITEGRRKTTGRDDAVLPRSVVYDPELTYSLPAGVTATSGMNALAHCVEAFWGPHANPVTDAIAAGGIRLLARGLPGAVTAPRDVEARALALQGAWLAGEASAAGTGLHHKLCHVLGGAFDLPHADTHAALLPYTAAFLLPAVPSAAESIGAAIGTEDAVTGIAKLARALGAPTSLGELGLTGAQAAEAAEITAAELPAAPRRPSREELRELLARAISGGDPGTWPPSTAEATCRA